MKTIMFLSSVPDERIEPYMKTAAGLGYRCVFCGKEDACARSLADAYYISDWSDTGELIRIAEKEKIDGVIALTDPSVIPAAKIAYALGLPGNPPESLEKLISKGAFRTLQEKAGLFCPKHAVFCSIDEIGDGTDDMRYPLIVKPLLCSTSFGQTILEDEAGMKEAFDKAAARSRDGRVCIEEYIEPGSLCTLEAEVFVEGDDILFEGVRDSWHTEEARTRPVYDVYPAHLTEEESEKLRHETAGALRAAGIRHGEFDMEGFFNRDGEFFVVEINARPSGYYNPQHIKLSTGVDLPKLLVTTSAGDMRYFNELKEFRRSARNILSYSVFPPEDGILDHIHIAPEMEARLIAFDALDEPKKGDRVTGLKTAEWPIVQAAFEFETAEELEAARKQISSLVYAVTE